MNLGVWQFQDRIRPLKKGQGAGYGLVQWDPAEKFIDSIPGMEGLSDAEKAKAINNLAANNPQKLMNHELDFLISSMKPGKKEWLQGIACNHNPPKIMTSEEFINSTKDSPSDLALVFNAHYERSGDYAAQQKDPNHKGLKNREDDAWKWYDYLR